MANCNKTKIEKTPLIDGAGLYKSGSIPQDHLSLGVELGSQVERVNTNGTPDSKGKLVVAFAGMSNWRQEIARFIKLHNETYGRSRNKTLYNAGRGAWDLRRMVNSADEYWNWFHAGLAKRNISPKQVQVIFIKNSIARQTLQYPESVGEYVGLMEKLITRTKHELPNLKQIYLTSAIYSGYANLGGPRPEPQAYYEGIAVREVVNNHLNETPWIGWSSYLWADGLIPRSDGLVWRCEDFKVDGTHPSESGTLKVAKMLLNFMQKDPTTTWFSP